jgi:hypothetical protein
METWETIGKALKGRWRDSKAKPFDAEFNRALVAAGGKPIRLEMTEFQKATMAYLCRDHTKIADYLCTHPLSRGQQAELAWALNERERPKKGRPTSLRQHNLIAYADFAIFFFKTWKEENAAHGIKDRGRRGEMKQQSCAFAFEYLGEKPWCGIGEADIEAVHDLMDRPASRRNI